MSMSMSTIRGGLSRALSGVRSGVHRLRMVLSGPTGTGATAHGTVANCWYCGRPAIVGEVCYRNPYTDNIFQYPHYIKESLVDNGTYVGVP